MPSNHILEVGEAPTVNPSGNAGDDNIHIQASPDAFGAQIGKAEEGLGQATTNVGTLGLDVLTQRQNETNEIYAADLQTWLNGENSKALSDFTKLQGQAAQNGLEGYHQKLQANYEAAIGQANSDQQRVLFARAGTAATDQYLKYGTIHSDGEYTKWKDSSDALHVADYGTQATQAAAYGDMAGADAFMSSANNTLRAKYEAQGYNASALDQVLRENTGHQVLSTVQQLALQGVNNTGPNIPAAKAFFDRYRDKMDPISVDHLDEWLKSRTTQYDGRTAADAAVKAADGMYRYTDPSLPAFAAAASSNPGSMSPQGMARLVQIESHGDPTARNASDHVGLVQASQDYWNRFGEGSRMDPNESIAALGRSTAADGKVLSRILGRQPTDGELYLAHQQGAGGAAALLNNPNERAGTALFSSGAYKTVEKADNAIRANGGNPDAPARAFANLWIGKFSGPGGTVTPGGGQTFQLPASVAGTYRAPYASAVSDPLTPIVNPALIAGQQPASALPDVAAQPSAVAGVPAPTAAPPAAEEPMSPASRKAAAFKMILENPSLSEDARQVALTHVSQLLQAQSIAEEADARSKAELSEKTAGTYFERIENGDTKDLAPAIINDRRMKYETRHALLDMLEKSSGDRNVKNYGNGYADAYRRIMLPENDEARIVNPLDLYRLGAPGGNLTMSGVSRLKGVLEAVRNDTNDATVARVVSSMHAYASERMTYTIPGIPGLTADKRDPKGTMLFNSEFVPRFEAAVDDWKKQGKSLWDPNSPVAKKRRYLDRANPAQAADGPGSGD